MSAPLVVVDADVLGRERTGDETYVENLLRLLPEQAGGELRFAAMTRRPDLVPPGVEPIEVRARPQELRMAVAVPLLLRRVRPALAHFQHGLPIPCPVPAVVTVHDLCFERHRSLMPWKDRLIFKLVVPRDCLASEKEADNRHALEHMAQTCKADTGPSAGIDFNRLRRAA